MKIDDFPDHVGLPEGSFSHSCPPKKWGELRRQRDHFPIVSPTDAPQNAGVQFLSP